MFIKKILSILPIFFLTLALSSSSVKGQESSLILVHDGYPMACCSNTDCHPVACEALKQTSDGGWTFGSFYFRKDQVQNFSKEGCHVCIGRNHEGHEAYPYCIQPPPNFF